MESTFYRVTKNPLVLLASSYILLALALIYVPPKPPLRLGALAGIVAYTLPVFAYVDASQIYCLTIYFYGCTHVGILLYSSYFLYLAPESPPQSATTFIQKVSWAYRLLSKPRGIGTSWKPKHLPRLSRSTPTNTLSRTEFLISRTLACIFFISLSAAFEKFDETYYWSFLRDGDYALEKERFIRRLPGVDVREVLIRLYLPLQFFLPTYSTFSAIHAGLSLVSVRCGQEPAVWPPLFGSLADSTSLRRFWSHFWQRFHRTAFVAHASLITHDFLRLRRGSRLSRGLMTSLVFVMSGLMHSWCSKLQSRKCDAGPVIHWFCLVAAGIVVEDCAQTAFAALEARLWKEPKVPQMMIWHDVLGYIWVWAFFAWSLPKMLYPNFGCALTAA